MELNLQYFGGRGSSGGKGGSAGGGRGGGGEGSESKKTLYNKSQVDELTKDFTPQMFLGDINNHYTGSLNSLKYSAEEYAPKELEIGGYTFKSMGEPYTTFEQTGRNTGKDIIQFEYQSTEMIGKEYPVLQVGVRVWRTPKGKVKSEIIRDGYTNKTRFW